MNDDYLNFDGWKDFLRSPQELAKEFALTNYNSWNELVFDIYLYDSCVDNSSIDSTNSLELQTLLNEISTYIRQKSDSCGYIWDVGPPIIHQDKEPIENGKYITYMSGRLRFYDSIEDEWFLISMLFEISKIYNNICISVHDNDGEILLIEAADDIPDWIGPENCQNRVWIAYGKIYILSMKKSQSISKEEAITNIKVVQPADDRVQDTLKKRIDANKKYLGSFQHRALCLLPESIAFLLCENPQLIAHIINCNAATDRLLRRKYLSAFSFLQGSLNLFSSIKRSKSLTGSNFVVASIKFTKTLYAKFKFEPFNVPKAMHGFRREAEAIANDLFLKYRYEEIDEGQNHNISEISKDEISTAIEIGSKILSGLEILYQTLEASSRMTKKSASVSPLDKAQSTEILKSILDMLQNYQTGDHESKYGSKVSFDSDKWIYLNSTEMDEKLNRNSAQNVSDEDDKSSMDRKDDISTLNSIIESVTQFVAKESSIDGIDNSAAAIHSTKLTAEETFKSKHIEIDVSDREKLLDAYKSLLDEEETESTMSLDSDADDRDDMTISNPPTSNVKSTTKVYEHPTDSGMKYTEKDSIVGNIAVDSSIIDGCGVHVLGNDKESNSWDSDDVSSADSDDFVIEGQDWNDAADPLQQASEQDGSDDESMGEDEFYDEYEVRLFLVIRIDVCDYQIYLGNDGE